MQETLPLIDQIDLSLAPEQELIEGENATESVEEVEEEFEEELIIEDFTIDGICGVY